MHQCFENPTSKSPTRCLHTVSKQLHGQKELQFYFWSPGCWNLEYYATWQLPFLILLDKYVLCFVFLVKFLGEFYKENSMAFLKENKGIFRNLFKVVFKWAGAGTLAWFCSQVKNRPSFLWLFKFPFPKARSSDSYSPERLLYTAKVAQNSFT